MSGRPGDVPISKFFTPQEIAEIDSQHPTEGDTAMSVNRTPLPENATREEKLAALPKLAGAVGNPAYETRLERLADNALSTLGDLDCELTKLADEFADRFAEDDARAVSRDRIAQTARTNRLKPRG